MSFAKESDKLAKELIDAEYVNACKNWGDKYNSLHEAYAILKEEIEETQERLDDLKKNLGLFWDGIRHDFLNVDFNSLTQEMLQDVIFQTLELAQCGAVLMKICNTIGEVK